MQPTRFRQWLENNKIYFDILAPVLFGVAATLVSLASYQLSRNQFNTQLEQSKPHFFVKRSAPKDLKLPPDFEVHNDGGTFESIVIQPMPFIQGMLPESRKTMNVPIYTHRTIERAGARKELIATIKSDLPLAYIQSLRATSQQFIPMGEEPSVLIRIRWRSLQGSGVQFFLNDEPIDQESAEDCFAYWSRESEDSPSTHNLSISKFHEYLSALQIQAARSERRRQGNCQMPAL